MPSPLAGKVPSRRKFTGMAQRKNATADEVEPHRNAPFPAKQTAADTAALQCVAARRLQTKKPRKTMSYGVMELLTGFEPVTSSLPRMRATDCAIAASVFHTALILYPKLPELSTDFANFFGIIF